MGSTGGEGLPSFQKDGLAYLIRSLQFCICLPEGKIITSIENIVPIPLWAPISLWGRERKGKFLAQGYKWN